MGYFMLTCNWLLQAGFKSFPSQETDKPNLKKGISDMIDVWVQVGSSSLSHQLASGGLSSSRGLDRPRLPGSITHQFWLIDKLITDGKLHTSVLFVSGKVNGTICDFLRFRKYFPFLFASSYFWDCTPVSRHLNHFVSSRRPFHCLRANSLELQLQDF